MPSNLFAAAAAAAVVRIRLPTKPQNDDGYSSSAYYRELFKRRETRRQGGREREETLTMFYKIERRRHDMIYDDAHDRNWTGGIFLFFSLPLKYVMGPIFRVLSSSTLRCCSSDELF